ncbi:hypothetical protein [Mycoplasma sp. HU2014]|uniref:hypothetical protein n=1 Tax=Mycoplasma sp. HU2014 TaxID=1664275 RepID=UPI00067AF698|nr:hypothetical protein [Mycoplasma sp. HU2014]KNG79776.1 hypothetical protein AB668_02190 [Mycoplasma sp. HU2014]
MKNIKLKQFECELTRIVEQHKQHNFSFPFVLIEYQSELDKNEIYNFLNDYFISNSISYKKSSDEIEIKNLFDFSRKDTTETIFLFELEKLNSKSLKFINYIFKKKLQKINKILKKISNESNIEFESTTLKELNNFRFICLTRSDKKISKKITNKFDFKFLIESNKFKENIMLLNDLDINNKFSNNAIKHIVSISKLDSNVAKSLLDLVDKNINKTDEQITKDEVKEIFNKFGIYELNNYKKLKLCVKQNTQNRFKKRKNKLKKYNPLSVIMVQNSEC